MISNTNKFENFTDAYLKIIKDIIQYGEWVDGVMDANSIGSDFGKKIRKTKELLVYTFCVTNPRDRYLRVINRKLHRAFALANFLWMLTGNKSGKEIIPFNEKGRAFLDFKGEINSAIGPHIFKLEGNTFIELESIETLLKNDPSTRRAVIQLFNQKDLIAQKDVPCFNHIQFFIRQDQLHCHIVMRSQSALMVMPYDFFLFSLLHEALATRLKIKLGVMYYSANSLHIYEDELEIAQFLSRENSNEKITEMKDFSNQVIKNLKNIFFDLSTLPSKGKNGEVVRILKNYNIDEYWKNLIIMHFD